MNPHLIHTLQLILYFTSWITFLLIFTFGNPGPYFFTTTLETHVCVSAPLGQFLPILDVTTNFFHIYSLLLSLGFLLLFIIRIRVSECVSESVSKCVSESVSECVSKDTIWWIMCSVSLAIRAYKSRNICFNLKKIFCDIPGFPVDWFDTTHTSVSECVSECVSEGEGECVLHRLPWYARIHPFLLTLSPSRVSNLSGSVSIIEVDITTATSERVSERVSERQCEVVTKKYCATGDECEIECVVDDTHSHTSTLLGTSDRDSDDCTYTHTHSSIASSEPLLIDIWTTTPTTHSSECSECSDTDSTRVVATDMHSNETPHTHTHTHTCTHKPVLLFLHGGGWLGGSKRMHSSVSLLHNMAVREWLVVSVGYRKQWPLHIDDAFAAYTWVRLCVCVCVCVCVYVCMCVCVGGVHYM